MGSCLAHVGDEIEASPKLLEELSAAFVFDSFGVDASRMQIMNARTVKCLEMGGLSAQGGSIRLKCALPTKSNANGVRSVFWECVPIKLADYGTSPVSFGVVSNRTS